MKAVDYLLKVLCVGYLDLKPENILYSSEEKWMKLCDFGCVFPAKNEEGTNLLNYYMVFTSGYMAPEFVEKRSPCLLGPLLVWQFGVVFFEIFLANCLTKFTKTGPEEEIWRHRFIQPRNEYIVEEKNLTFPYVLGCNFETASKDMKDLLCSMCAFYPESRISWSDLIDYFSF